MASPKQKNDEADYFQLRFGSYAIWLGLYAFAAALYAPEWLTWHFGPFGTFAKYCVANHFYWTNLIFHFIVGAHICEGFLALYMCRSFNMSTWTTFKWIVQTLGGGLEGILPLIIFYLRHKGLMNKRK